MPQRERQGIGTGMIGSRSIGGPWIPSPPYVGTVTSPGGAVSTGGPGLAVSAPHQQDEGVPTTHVRLVVSNTAETTVYHDTGWLARAVDADDPIQFTIDMDAINAPHNGENVRFRVHGRITADAGVGTVNRRAGTSAQKSVTISWGNPQCTITAPIDGSLVLTATGLVVEWTFSDGAKTQSAFRVQVRKTDSLEIVFSSGWVASAATSYEVPFIFSEGGYDIVVQLKNNHGIRSA